MLHLQWPPWRTGAAALLAMALAACSGNKLTPWQATPLVASLPTSCSTPASGTTPAGEALTPGGVSVVRSEGREVVLVANRACVIAVDAASGAAEPLPTHGDSIAPTMVHASSSGVAFASSVSGSVRAINADGAVTFNLSGLATPLGVRLLPGGAALVAEYGSGRVLRVGPNADSRPRLVVDGLDGPVGLVVVDATRAYVTERRAGRITEFRLDQYAKRVVVRKLDQPEGLTQLADGGLVVVEAGRQRLLVVDPANGKTRVMADQLPIGGSGNGSGLEPGPIADVAAAPDGLLYLSAAADRQVLRISPRPDARR
jgi:outer membrane protein assembly factor BamB